MMNEQHEWKYGPDGNYDVFQIITGCRIAGRFIGHRKDIERIIARLNENVALKSSAEIAHTYAGLLEEQNAALLDVVRDCVNFLADLNTKSDRAKALHKRAYTAHSKAKGE